MARAAAWFTGNDMLVELAGLASSTNSTSYINNSTGVRVSVWSTPSTVTSADEIVNAAAMSYVSSGLYRYTGQSTTFSSLAIGDRGMAIVTVSHSGLTGEWRAYFRVERRGTT